MDRFKPGVAYIRKDGKILNIIGNDERANFMLVQWLDGKLFPVDRKYFILSEFKELGNSRVAQVLYSKIERGE